MTFKELQQEILGDLDKVTGNDIFRACKRVVAQINRRIDGIDTIEVAYTSGAASTGYTWTAASYALTLNSYVKALKKVWIGDNEYTQRDYETLINISSGYYYAKKGRNVIVFPSAVLSATSDDLLLEIFKNIENFADTDPATVMTIPDSFKEVVIDGVMKWLLALPKFKDKDLYDEFTANYERGLEEIETLENFKFSRSLTDMEYLY